MANDAFTQQALAADPFFRKRVRSAMSTVAWQIETESNTTPNHTNRLNYARQVIRQLDNEVTIILPSFVMRPNVNNFETSYHYDFSQQVGQVVTASGDADLMSQLATDWDQMAAAAGFSAGMPT
jgi:hypothetical protein